MSVFYIDMSAFYIGILRVFLLTLLIEGVAIFFVFLRKKYVYYSVLCNLLTNPTLNLLLSISVIFFGARAYYPVLIAAEIAIIFIEAGVYNYICGFGMKKAVMVSAFLNILSFTAGLLLFHL